MIWFYVVIVCLGVAFYVGVGLLISELISKHFLKEPSKKEKERFALKTGILEPKPNKKKSTKLKGKKAA